MGFPMRLGEKRLLSNQASIHSHFRLHQSCFITLTKTIIHNATGTSAALHAQEGITIFTLCTYMWYRKPQSESDVCSDTFFQIFHALTELCSYHRHHHHLHHHHNYYLNQCCYCLSKTTHCHSPHHHCYHRINVTFTVIIICVTILTSS